MLFRLIILTLISLTFTDLSLARSYESYYAKHPDLTQNLYFASTDNNCGLVIVAEDSLISEVRFFSEGKLIDNTQVDWVVGVMFAPRTNISFSYTDRFFLKAQHQLVKEEGDSFFEYSLVGFFNGLTHLCSQMEKLEEEQFPY